LFRPRDVFVEQTVARLAQTATVADTAADLIDDGVGPVIATPIIGWLHDVAGPTDQFNQTVLIQAPVGTSEADVVVVLQAVLDRHAMLRLRVDDDGAGGWSLTVPEAGAVDAAHCLHTVDVLSEDVIVAARSRLNPAAGQMVSALWVAPTGQLLVIAHHLAVDGVSWRILLEDLNLAWTQPGTGHLVSAMGVAAGRACARSRSRGAGRHMAADRCGGGAVAGGTTGGRYLRQRRQFVGGLGSRDDPDAAQRGAGGVPRRDQRRLVDRICLGAG
jgi:hypothetical protein